MNSFTITEKYAIINILSRIMRADGIIHPNEEEYLNKVYNLFSITIDDLENISCIDDIQANNIVHSMTKINKNIAKSLFVEMADIDNERHPKEIKIIEKVFN